MSTRSRVSNDGSLSLYDTCASPPPEQVSALPDEVREWLSQLRSSTPAGASDASTCFEDCNHSDDNTATETLYDGTFPISTSSAEGVGLTFGLEPTYMGHVPTMEEAHVLFEACLSGRLRPLLRGPRPDELPSLIRSGNVFLYEHGTSGIKNWDDGTCWSPIYHDDGFWVSRQSTNANGVRKKRISIPTRRAFYHLVCYYHSWDTVDGTLTPPSQNLRDTTVGTELASRDTTQSLFRKEQLSLNSELAAFNPADHLRFMRYAQFLCLRVVNDQDHGNILAWDKQCWFPILRTDEKYWLELSLHPIFVGMTSEKLVRQMRLLLSTLLQIPHNRPLSQLVNPDQPSEEFSPLQNLQLICEAFLVPANLSNPFRTLNWTELSQDLSLSKLSAGPENIGPEVMQAWWVYLSSRLPIDSPLDDLRSRSISPVLHIILKHLSVKDSRAVCINMAFYQQQFPNFRDAKNHESLFFVICYTMCTGEWTMEMLDGWIKSKERTRIYHRLLTHFQDSSAFDELVLSLAALLLFYGISKDADPPESSPKASLTNLNRFFHGQCTIEHSFFLLSSTLWTFLRVLADGGDIATCNALIQLLGHVAHIPDPLPHVVDTTLEDYWMKRVPSQVTHNEAMAQVQERVEPVRSPVGDRSLGEGTEEKEDNQFGWKDFLCLPVNCGIPVHAPQLEGPWFSTVLEALGMGEIGWGVWEGRTGWSPWSRLS